MSFIITVVAVGARVATVSKMSGILTAPVPDVREGEGKAGYLPGLTRHLGRVITGAGVYVMMPGEGGYLSSTGFFQMGDGQRMTALRVQSILRNEVDRVLRELLIQSPSKELVIVLEFNGSVTGPDPTWGETVVDIFGPWSIDQFWLHHDLGTIVDDSVVLLEGS